MVFRKRHEGRLGIDFHPDQAWRDRPAPQKRLRDEPPRGTAGHRPIHKDRDDENPNAPRFFFREDPPQAPFGSLVLES